MAYPITIYKTGEQKTIEHVDRQGWFDDGWTLEPQPEEKPEEKPLTKHRKEAVKVEAE
jgi:hypothetical protein